MLVLKRKVGEIVRIGNDVELHVLAVEGDVIKLGFEAPRHVHILRSEVYEAIKNENLNSTMDSFQGAKDKLQKFKLNHQSKTKK